MTTHMRREIEEIPAATGRLLAQSGDAIKAAAGALETLDPRVVITVARGSSDHAATFFKYACEMTTGVPVASVGPSVASIYGAQLRLKGAACVAISQSGQSPDIVAMAASATAEGAASIAITNKPGAPLAEACDHTIAMNSGVETSVAATKTFVASAVAGLALLAHWTRDTALIGALEALPQHFEAALTQDWSALAAALDGQDSMFVLGRGPSYAMALEAALKFKETCQIHAQAYSSAEVLHGPVSVVGQGFPALALASRDASEPGIVEVSEALAKGGADVYVTSAGAVHARRLGFAPTGHPLTDPLALIVSFYAFVEALARARGINPDAPRNLKKVTETV